MVGLLIATGLTIDARAGNQVMADGYYARETTDGPWHIRIVGTVPSLCGAYVLVFGAGGDIVFRARIPHGTYPEDAPLLLKVPADGVTGDYKIKVIGHQRDLLGIQVPMTDLGAEVYGGTSFTIGHDEGRRIAFKVADQEELTVSAYKGHLKVRDAAGRVVADTCGTPETPPQVSRYSNLVTFPAKAGETYWIEPTAFYFGAKSRLFLTFDPDTWFLPNPLLDEVKWWRQ